MLKTCFKFCINKVYYCDNKIRKFNNFELIKAYFFGINNKIF